MGFFNTKSDVKRDAKILRINTPQLRPVLDPRQAGDIVSHSIAQLLYDRLFDVCPDDRLSYSIAKSVEKKSSLHYIIHLNKWLWSDGTALTAEDFIRSWLSILSKSCPSPNAHLFFPIQGAKAIYHDKAPITTFGAKALDEKTIEIILDSPHPAFLNLLAFPTFAAVHPSLDLFYQGMLPIFKIVTSGFYQIDSWEKGHKMVLQANICHHIAQKVLYPSIEINFIQDPATVVHLFENGQLDLMGGAFTAVPFELENLDECLYEHSTAATSLCSFNLNEPLLKSANLRRALTMSIDFDEVIRVNPSSLSYIEATLAPEVLYKKLPADKKIYSYKPLLAKQSLENALVELKLKQLPPLTLIHSHIGLHPKIAQVLSSQWEKNLGISITLQPYDPQMLLFHTSKQTFQISLTTLIPQYGDPLAFLQRFEDRYDTEETRLSMQSYRDLLKNAQMATDLSLKEAHYHQAEALLYQNYQIIPLCRWKTRYLHHLKKNHFATLSMGSIHWKTILSPDMKEYYVPI